VSLYLRDGNKAGRRLYMFEGLPLPKSMFGVSALQHVFSDATDASFITD